MYLLGISMWKCKYLIGERRDGTGEGLQRHEDIGYLNGREAPGPEQRQSVELRACPKSSAILHLA